MVMGSPQSIAIQELGAVRRWASSGSLGAGNAGNQPAPARPPNTSHDPTSARRPQARVVWHWSNLVYAPLCAVGTPVPREQLATTTRWAALDLDDDTKPEGEENCPGSRPNSGQPHGVSAGPPARLHRPTPPTHFATPRGQHGRRGLELPPTLPISVQRLVGQASAWPRPAIGRASRADRPGPYDTDNDGLDNPPIPTTTTTASAETADKCPIVADAAQAGTDGDAMGTACDRTPTRRRPNRSRPASARIPLARPASPSSQIGT